MAHVTLDGQGNITGIFAVAQNPPVPPGYAIISDHDPRIATFQDAAIAALKPRPLIATALLTTAEQAALLNYMAAQSIITPARAAAIITAIQPTAVP